MIILASANAGVRERWIEGVGDTPEPPSASSLAELEPQIGKVRSDPVMLHLSLPELDGEKGVASLRRAHPDARLMVFTDRPNEDEGRRLLGAGVYGYCNTYMAPPLIAKAVDLVRLGEVWVGRRLIRSLIEDFSRVNGERLNRDAERQLGTLTEREAQIARLVGGAASNKQIARELDISERTVKAHVAAIFRKTETRDRLQLALLVNGQRSAVTR